MKNWLDWDEFLPNFCKISNPNSNDHLWFELGPLLQLYLSLKNLILQFILQKRQKPKSIWFTSINDCYMFGNFSNVFTSQSWVFKTHRVIPNAIIYFFEKNINFYKLFLFLFFFAICWSEIFEKSSRNLFLESMTNIGKYHF